MKSTFENKLLREYSNRNEQPLASYSNGRTKKVWWQCEICSHTWQTRISHRTNGHGCPICGVQKVKNAKTKKLVSIQKTDPHIASEWADEHSIIHVSRGCNTKYQWKCPQGHVYTASPNSRCLSGQGCPYCYGRYPTDKNRLSVIRPDLSKELLADASQICCNSNKVYQWKCANCKHEWASTVNNRFRGRGCPKCALKNSKPQQKIESYLSENSISYLSEYRISDCKNKRPLPFDFAVMKDETPDTLIEYQGEQHFFPIWGAQNLLKTQHNDEIKEQYCEHHGIKLVKINYWQQDAIPEILDNLFKDT